MRVLPAYVTPLQFARVLNWTRPGDDVRSKKAARERAIRWLRHENALVKRRGRWVAPSSLLVRAFPELDDGASLSPFAALRTERPSVRVRPATMPVAIHLARVARLLRWTKAKTLRWALAAGCAEKFNGRWFIQTARLREALPELHEELLDALGIDL